MKQVFVSLVLAAIAPSLVQAQCEFAKLTDCDAPPFFGGDPEDFGESIALQGDRAVIGNRGASAGAARDGCVLVYERNGLNWFETAELEAPGYTPDFGRVVAVDGDVVVGSDGINDLWIFERDGGNWGFTQGFSAPNQFSQLGKSLAVDGLRFLAGGTTTNPNRAVFVYEKSGGVWSQADTLSTSTPGSADFGESVALQGDTAVVGARRELGPKGEPSAGAVYVFEFDGALWSQTARLQPTDPTLLGHFGWDVDIDGGRIAVGAPASGLAASAGGAVITYVKSGSAWIFEDAFAPADVATGDGFGQSLDLDGTRLVAGAPGRDAGGGTLNAGGAYAFDFTGSAWTETATLVPMGRGLSDQIGTDVAVAGDLTLLSAPGDDDEGPNYGAVYALSITGSLCKTFNSYPARVSLTSGGAITLELRATAAHANRTYFVAGTIQGTNPGLPFKGALIPLSVDAYFRFSLRQSNTTSFQNTFGTLNGLGRANAQVTLPAGLPVSLAGLKLHHAFLVFEGGLSGGVRHVSNAVLTRLDP